MKKIAIFFCTVFCFSALSMPVSAESLREDYKQLEEKRKRIETERRTYETQLRKLSSKRYGLSLAVNKCVAQNNAAGWEAKLEEAKARKDKLEKERLGLVDLRKKLDAARSEFESIRSAIEKKYRGTSRGKPYEAEFRKYMKDLDTKYIDRVDPELFSGYESYLSGVEVYVVFLERFLNECSEMVKNKEQSGIEIIESPVAGKMEVKIRIASIPSDVKTTENGMKEFSVDADGEIVKVTVRPEIWKKLEKAEKRPAEWAAVVTGRVGKRFSGGFFLKDSDIRVLGDRM